jgi:hypothetical protein
LRQVATGDGTYITGTLTPALAGCYAWAVRATVDGFTVAQSFPATPGEQMLVSVVSVAVAARGTPQLTGEAELGGQVTVNGAGAAAVILEGTLLGPVPVGATGSCAGGHWATAPVVAHIGPVPLTGTSQTLGQVSVTGTGCYSWSTSVLAGGVLVARGAPGAPGTLIALSSSSVTASIP